MSAAQASAVRAPRRGAPDVAPTSPRRAPVPATPARPRLHVVRAPAQARTRVPFVLLCMALLASSLLGALLLNTAMAQGEYERIALQNRLSESSQVQEQKTAELQTRSSSAQLAAAAQALGMIPTAHGAYLRLSDGAILGDPVPAGPQG
ncbi:hypothetical protein [Actinotalea subterranea]|uniref:hypothetical protein n=1 Tax=Actinotalea subterranea TaxID=2607497 RepID=UPI0011EFF0A4|nr:hypothetical protein [Actinotalea subterranea]